MIPAKTLLSSLRMVKHAVAVKDVRQYLCGTSLEFTGTNELFVVGCDGLRLMVVRLQVEHGGILGQWIATAATVEKILALWKTYTGDLFIMSDSEKKLSVFDATGSVVKVETIDGNYPHWPKLFDAMDGDGTAEVTILNPQYIAEACGAIHKELSTKKKDAGIELRTFGSDIRTNGRKSGVLITATRFGPVVGIVSVQSIIAPVQI